MSYGQLFKLIEENTSTLSEVLQQTTDIKELLSDVSAYIDQMQNEIVTLEGCTDTDSIVMKAHCHREIERIVKAFKESNLKELLPLKFQVNAGEIPKFTY